MKRVWLALMLFWLIACVMGCAKVDQGYEAAKINTFGTEKGGIEVLGPGRHFYNPIKYDLKQSPTFFQEYIWTSSKEEGSALDESITFQSANSLKFTANVGAKITLKKGMVGELYQKYHKTMEEIMVTNFRNTLRDAFNRKASMRDAEAIYGSGKTAFVKEVEQDVSKTWEKFFSIERIYLIDSLDPPPQLITAIEDKIKATQKALQRENEVAEETAKANKIIEAAKGAAKARELKADAMAYATVTEATAKADAIKLVQKQLDKSPAYIQYIKANRWDGKLPVYMGGDSPLPMINVTQ